MGEGQPVRQAVDQCITRRVHTRRCQSPTPTPIQQQLTNRLRRSRPGHPAAAAVCLSLEWWRWWWWGMDRSMGQARFVLGVSWVDNRQTHHPTQPTIIAELEHVFRASRAASSAPLLPLFQLQPYAIPHPCHAMDGPTRPSLPCVAFDRGSNRARPAVSPNPFQSNPPHQPNNRRRAVGERTHTSTTAAPA